MSESVWWTRISRATTGRIPVPLGHRLFQGSQAGPDSEAFTVVGVVGSTKQAGLTDDAAQGAVYYPYIYRPDAISSWPCAPAPVRNRSG